MLTDRMRLASRGLVEPLALAAGRLGLSPNSITVLGCTLHLGVAWLLAAGRPQAGAVALALAAAFDGLDGTLARLTGRVSRRGGFLDSTLDRVSEILVFGGLLIASGAAGDPVGVVLCYAVITGSIMVSYTRAKSEALGCGTKAGMFGRLERMLVLIVGLLAGQLRLTLWILAIGVWLTTALRIADVWRRCAEDDAAA